MAIKGLWRSGVLQPATPPVPTSFTVTGALYSTNLIYVAPGNMDSGVSFTAPDGYIIKSFKITSYSNAGGGTFYVNNVVGYSGTALSGSTDLKDLNYNQIFISHTGLDSTRDGRSSIGYEMVVEKSDK